MHCIEIEVLLNEERIERLRRSARRQQMASMVVRSEDERALSHKAKQSLKVATKMVTSIWSKPDHKAEKSYDQPGFEA
jgi:hypothetical protein